MTWAPHTVRVTIDLEVPWPVGKGRMSREHAEQLAHLFYVHAGVLTELAPWAGARGVLGASCTVDRHNLITITAGDPDADDDDPDRPDA